MATVLITPNLDAVVSEIEIAAPPERVFAALTDAEQCMRWGQGENCEITRWEIDPRAGGKWRFLSRKPGDHDNRIHQGEILEIDPPRVLAYTWFANWHTNPDQKTIVRWELTPSAAGTKLKVTHSGLGTDETMREGYQGGWPGLLQRLQQYFAH